MYNGDGRQGTTTDRDEYAEESLRPGPTPTPWASRSVTSGRPSLWRSWHTDRGSVPGTSAEYDEDGQAIHDAANAVTPVSGYVSRNTTRGSRRPYCPDDIGIPVEIGDNEGGAARGDVSTEKDNAHMLSIDETPGLEEDDPHATRFELLGSLPTSPLEDAEAYNPIDRDLASPSQTDARRK